VDVVFLDVDRKAFGPKAVAQVARQQLRNSLLLTYLDSQVWISAVEDQIVRSLGEALEELPLVIAGDHPKSRFLALRLSERGARVTILSAEGDESPSLDVSSIRSLSIDPKQVDILRLRHDAMEANDLLAQARLVVVWPSRNPWFDCGSARHLQCGTYVLDAGIGSILPDGQEMARSRGALLIRVNVWPTLAGALSAAHESSRVHRESYGWERMAGVPVIAGGALGQYGDVVVDSVRQPTRVIGVSDGHGRVLFKYGEQERESVLKVSEEIHRRLVSPRLNPDA
jgi:hypothetical protein